MTKYHGDTMNRNGDFTNKSEDLRISILQRIGLPENLRETSALFTWQFTCTSRSSCQKFLEAPETIPNWSVSSWYPQSSSMDDHDLVNLWWRGDPPVLWNLLWWRENLQICNGATNFTAHSFPLEGLTWWDMTPPLPIGSHCRMYLASSTARAEMIIGHFQGATTSHPFFQKP
jgi:hypothetical protein